MELYHYLGVSKEGKRVKGRILSDNAQDLEQRLENLEVSLISFRRERNRYLNAFGQQKIKPYDLILMTRQLHQLLSVGLSLLEILTELKMSTKNRALSELISTVVHAMHAGSSFSKALSPFESVFGRIYIRMISVGEKSGNLIQVLQDLERILSWQQALAHKSKRLLFYPMMVGVVVLTIAVLMMVFVVPELMSFIRTVDGDVGWSTTALIATSEFFQKYYLWLFLCLIVMISGVRWGRSNNAAFSLKLDEMYLRLPIIGPSLLQIYLSRMARNVAMMMASGLHFTDALLESKKIVKNQFLCRKVELVAQSVVEGTLIHRAFDSIDLVPKVAIRMIKVGEMGGDAEGAFQNVATYFESEVSNRIQRIEPLVEPALTVFMAVVVGWIVLAAMMPIYQTVSMVN